MPGMASSLGTLEVQNQGPCLCGTDIFAERMAVCDLDINSRVGVEILGEEEKEGRVIGVCGGGTSDLSWSGRRLG